MAIFGRSHSVTAQTVTAPVYEGYGVEVNGDILAIQESWEDQLAVIEALHAVDMEELALRSDIKTLQEGSSEIEARYAEYETVTEAAVKDVWAKIKEFFSKLWGKIKAFFKSVVRVFDGIFKNAQDFVKKYEGQLKKLNLRGFKYKMFNYTNLDDIKLMSMDIKGEAEELYDFATKSSVQGENEHIIQTLTDKTNKLRENKEDELDKYRGKVAGSGSLSSEQFSQALFAEFRGGAKTREDKAEIGVEIETIMSAVKNAGEGKKKAEEFSKQVDEQFSKIIKDIDALAGKVESAKVGDDKMSSTDLGEGKGGVRRFKADASTKIAEALRLYSTIFSAKKAIQLEVFRAWQDAWKERNSTYKQVCLAAFRHKAEK